MEDINSEEPLIPWVNHPTPEGMTCGYMLLPAIEEAKLIVADVAKQLGFKDPIAFFSLSTLCEQKRDYVKTIPINGLEIKGWTRTKKMKDAQYLFMAGAAVFCTEGIVHAVLQAQPFQLAGYCFGVIDRSNYYSLYKISLKRHKEVLSSANFKKPVLSSDMSTSIWDNTIGFLESKTLETIVRFGGRAKRGVLFSGPPGNGKTMTIRWLMKEASKRNWETKNVNCASYMAATQSGDPVQAIHNLFSCNGKGLVCFDDMDIAIRDRDTCGESDHQNMFLTCMDGVNVGREVVHLFTTNCDMRIIDRAFKRPGRIDAVYTFDKPDIYMRAELLSSWPEEIVGNVSLVELLDQTDNFSYADMEEIRVLLITEYAKTGIWDAAKALRSFKFNRKEFEQKNTGGVGFAGIVNKNREEHADNTEGALPYS